MQLKTVSKGSINVPTRKLITRTKSTGQKEGKKKKKCLLQNAPEGQYSAPSDGVM